MERCKSSRKGEEFVREVCGAPDPRCILVDDWQMSDVVAFCCTNERPDNVILGIDPTFNLGNFYATFTVYRHPGLKNKHGRHPLMLGPVLVHTRKTYQTYQYFASGLTRVNPDFRYLKCFGTDGEGPLYNAFSDVCSEADHLLCFLHVRKNIEAKLKELGFSQPHQRETLEEIFGTPSSFDGLVNADTSEDFEATLNSLEDVWRKREPGQEKFFNWFKEEKVWCKNLKWFHISFCARAHVVRTLWNGQIPILSNFYFGDVTKTCNFSSSEKLKLHKNFANADLGAVKF